MIRKKKGREAAEENPLVSEEVMSLPESEVSEESELSELSEVSEKSELSELSELSEVSDNSDNSDSSDSSDNSDPSGLKEKLQSWLSQQAEERLLELVRLGMDYDRAVAEARRQGEETAKNKRIEELMEECAQGDGVPHPFSGSGSFDTRRAPSIFDLARG